MAECAGLCSIIRVPGRAKLLAGVHGSGRRGTGQQAVPLLLRMKWKGIVQLFMPNSGELRAKFVNLHASANSKMWRMHSTMSRTSRQYGVENDAYLTFTREGHRPRPFLGLLCSLPRRLRMEQPPGGGTARGGQYSPKRPRHLQVPVRCISLQDLHLVRPIPHQDVRRVHDDGGDVVGERERNMGCCVHTGGAWHHLGGG